MKSYWNTLNDWPIWMNRWMNGCTDRRTMFCWALGLTIKPILISACLWPNLPFHITFCNLSYIHLIMMKLKVSLNRRAPSNLSCKCFCFFLVNNLLSFLHTKKQKLSSKLLLKWLFCKVDIISEENSNQFQTYIYKYLINNEILIYKKYK